MKSVGHILERRITDATGGVIIPKRKNRLFDIKDLSIGTGGVIWNAVIFRLRTYFNGQF